MNSFVYVWFDVFKGKKMMTVMRLLETALLCVGMLWLAAEGGGVDPQPMAQQRSDVIRVHENQHQDHSAGTRMRAPCRSKLVPQTKQNYWAMRLVIMTACCVDTAWLRVQIAWRQTQKRKPAPERSDLRLVHQHPSQQDNDLKQTTRTLLELLRDKVIPSVWLNRTWW